MCSGLSRPLNMCAAGRGVTYLRGGPSRHEHSSDRTCHLLPQLAIDSSHSQRVKIYPPRLRTLGNPEDARMSSYPSCFDVPLNLLVKRSVDCRHSPDSNFQLHLPFRHVPTRRWIQHSLWRGHRHRRRPSPTTQELRGQSQKGG